MSNILNLNSPDITVVNRFSRPSFNDLNATTDLTHRISKVSNQSIHVESPQITKEIKASNQLPPLIKDSVFDSDPQPDYRTPRPPGPKPKPRKKPLDSDFHHYEIRVPTKLLSIFLCKAKEQIQLLSVGTFVSCMPSEVYREINEHLSVLKADIYEMSDNFQHLSPLKLRRQRGVLVVTARTLITKVENLQKRIDQILRFTLDESTKYDLRDLRKELGELKKQYLQPLTIL